MEAGTENTSTAARTARVIRLPGRAGWGVTGGDGRASGGGEGYALLRAAHEAAGGSCSRPVKMRPLARRLGLTPRAVEVLAMRLQAERLVRVVSMADGLMRLTAEGVRAAVSAGNGPPGPAAATGAPADPVLGRAAVRELGGMLGPLMADLDRLDLGGALDGERRSELAAEVRTIEAQLGSPKPKLRIVAAALGSIKDVVGSAGGPESGRISRAIDAFLDGAVPARPAVGPAGGDGSGVRRPEEEERAGGGRAPETGGVRVRKRVRDGGGRPAERARGTGRPPGGGAGDQAARGAAGAPLRAGEAADRATAREAGAGRRVMRVVGPSGDVVRTTLNGDGEILDEDVVGSVVGPPIGGHPGHGGRRVSAVSPAGGGDGNALRSATAPKARRLDEKRPMSGGEYGTENRRARTREHGGEKVTEQTQGAQQQSQEDQYLQQAQDFFAQSMGRIKGQMQSDHAQLQSYMQQLPPDAQAQLQEMTDSYARFEGTVDRTAQDAGVQDSLEEAAQQARQNADQASGQGGEDQAAGQPAPLADSLPEGYQALGQPFTDQQGNQNLQGQDEEGNTVVVQRAEDDEGGVVDTIYDQQGNVMDEVVPEEGGEEEPRRGR